jgi:hypothetical protein
MLSSIKNCILEQFMNVIYANQKTMWLIFVDMTIGLRMNTRVTKKLAVGCRHMKNGRFYWAAFFLKNLHRKVLLFPNMWNNIFNTLKKYKTFIKRQVVRNVNTILKVYLKCKAEEFWIDPGNFLDGTPKQKMKLAIALRTCLKTV